MGKFRSSVNKAFGALRRAAVGAAIIGGAAIAGFAISAIKTFAETGDEIQKMALRTGFSTEALSELKFAAEQSGASLNDIEKVIKKMQITILDANLGLSTATDAFSLLGISVADLNKLNPEQQFNLITRALIGVENSSLRAALAQKVFGRAGTTLLPLLAEGERGIQALREEAQRLGIVFSQDSANAAADFVDAQNKASKALDGLKIQIANEIVPTLTTWIEWFVDNKVFNLGCSSKLLGEAVSKPLSAGAFNQGWNEIVRNSETSCELLGTLLGTGFGKSYQTRPTRSVLYSLGPSLGSCQAALSEWR